MPSLEQELKQTVDAIGVAFNEFKAQNDRRLKEVEKAGEATAETKAATDRANAQITELQAKMATLGTQIRSIENAAAREPVDARDPKVKAKEMANVAAFMARVQNRPLAAPVTDADLEVYRNYRTAFAAHLLKGDNITPEFRNALSVGTDPSGGLWAPPDVTGQVIELLYETSPMRQVASVVSTAAPSYEGYNDLNEASTGWVGEQTARTETNTPDIGAWAIPLMEQYAAPRATQRMIDFSIRDPEAWLAGKVADKVSRTENNAFILGNGVAKPRGLTTYAAGTPTAAAWNKIQQLGTGTSGAFAASKPGDVLINTIFAVKAPYRQNARWLMGRLTLAEVRKLVDGQGNYLWQRDFQQSMAGTLLGYPITECEDFAAIGANSLSIAFGDFKQGYQIVDHVTGLRVLRDPFTAKPWVVFYTTKYVGGDVVNFEAIKLVKFG